MIRTNRARRISVVLAAAALVLTACGDDSSSDSPPEASDTPASSDSTESAPPTDETSAPPTASGTLKIGELLPQTGDLAYLGPPEFAGTDLAIKEINAAGGVLGNKVESFKADSGDGTPDIAGASVDGLLAKNVSTIVGAAASSVSLSVIDKITGAGVVQFSPANTAAAFDTYDDKGLYFRTAPSDRLQGQVLGNLAVQDGFSNVAVLARQDAYGEGLADQVAATLKEKGATVATETLYNADAQNFTAEINKVAATKPDALVLVAFDETTKIIPALTAKGIGPQDIQLYFVDGNVADYSDQSFDLTGVKGTFPAPPEVDPSFNQRLKSVNPKLKDFTYGPQAYDAVNLTALAAVAAGSTDGKDIASKLIEVSSEGTACKSYTECLPLLMSGEDINYEGASGPVDLNKSGSPSAATIGIQEYTKNKYKQIDSVSGLLP